MEPKQDELKPPRKHDLKTWQPYYDDVVAGIKRFEIRKNDRDFQVGDILLLREYDPIADVCSGRTVAMDVVTLIEGGQFGVESGYCVMGIEPCSALKADAPTEPVVEALECAKYALEHPESNQAFALNAIKQSLAKLQQNGEE